MYSTHLHILHDYTYTYRLHILYDYKVMYLFNHNNYDTLISKKKSHSQIVPWTIIFPCNMQGKGFKTIRIVL